MGRKRRGRGEGSIYQRGDGTWAASVSLGHDAQGKRLRKDVYGKTKKEVQEKLRELQNDPLNGMPIKPENLTVDDHFQDWFKAKAGDVKDTTLSNYKRVYNSSIKPHLGHIKIKSLDYRRINALFEHLEEKGLTRSISIASFLLRSSLEDATRKGLVPVNQGKLSASRRQKKKEARYMNQEEIKAFLKAAQGERLEDFFILALHTGLRPGELLGLSWESVNLKERKLIVKQALIEESGKLWLDDVKTNAGRRTISLSNTAIEALKRQRKRQLEDQLACKRDWENDKNNLVFTNKYGGLLRRTEISKKVIKRINNKAGLEGVKPHTLRHTHASILIFQGEDPKTISSRLGHEDVAFTLQVYGHLFPGRDESAASQVDKFFETLK